MARHNPKGITFYPDRICMLRSIPAEELKKAFWWSIDYAMTGEMPKDEVPQGTMLAIAWDCLRESVEHSLDLYQKQVRDNTLNGYKSAFLRYAEKNNIDASDDELFLLYVEKQEAQREKMDKALETIQRPLTTADGRYRPQTNTTQTQTTTQTKTTTKTNKYI